MSEMENDGAKYCEDFILRKEGRKKWMQYWVVIRGVWMLFYTDNVTTDRDHLRGAIELTTTTKCSIARRRNYSFPFYISTERGTHLFKCDSNLKRHQWLYLIGLAIKGAPPMPAPSYIPSPAVVVSEDELFQSAPTDREEIDRPDSETDEDEWSLPPGVIVVTTPMDELFCKDNLSTANNNNNNAEGAGLTQNLRQRNVSSRAVLTTGITGTTTVALDPKKTDHVPKTHVTSPIPKTSSSFEYTAGGLLTRRKSPTSLSLDASNHQSPYVWNRGSPDRPNSSPSPTSSPRDSFHQLIPSGLTRANMKFSRYMAKSAPDIKLLSLDDPT